MPDNKGWGEYPIVKKGGREYPIVVGGDMATIGYRGCGEGDQRNADYS